MSAFADLSTRDDLELGSKAPFRLHGAVDINLDKDSLDTGLSWANPYKYKTRALASGASNLSHFATWRRTQLRITPGRATPFAVLVICP